MVREYKRHLNVYMLYCRVANRMSAALLEQMAFGEPYSRPQSRPPLAKTDQCLELLTSTLAQQSSSAATVANDANDGENAEQMLHLASHPCAFKVTGLLSMPLLQHLDQRIFPSVTLHQQNTTPF